MTASIKFRGMSVTKAHRGDAVGQIDYDGEVTFAVQSESVNFDYVHKFKNRQSIDLEIVNGIGQLKIVLEDMVKAADHFHL